MEKKNIVAKNIEATEGDTLDWTELIASSETEEIKIAFETMAAPSVAASIILSSQKAAKKLDINKIEHGMAANLKKSMQMLPEALDIATILDGEVLCINVGSGSLFFKLTEPAKRALNRPIKDLG